jgi:hypothetical protein
MWCLIAALAIVLAVAMLSVIVASSKRRTAGGAPRPADATFALPAPDAAWVAHELKKLSIRLKAPSSVRLEEIAWEGIEPELKVTLPNGYECRVKPCPDFAKEVAEERAWVSDPSHRQLFQALLEAPDAFVHTASEAPYGQYWAAMAASAPVRGVVYYAHTHGTILKGDQRTNISAQECAQLVAMVRTIGPL